MPITFRCPDGHKLNVPEALAGRKARCPACRRKMYVPADNSDPHQVARPAPDDSSKTEFRADDATSTTLIVAVAVEEPAEATTPSWPDIATDVALEALDAPQLPSKTAPHIYKPDPGKVQTVRMLAVGLVLAALFTAGPVAWHPNPFAAPDWLRLVLLLSILQLAYVAWLLTLPDWVSVWVAMLVNALVATVYGAALAIFLYTPVESPLGLGLGEVSRRTAAGWCLCVVLITIMTTFACGRVCAVWRRADEWKRKRQNVSSSLNH